MLKIPVNDESHPSDLAFIDTNNILLERKAYRLRFQQANLR